jgi:hypothetical protein
MMFRTSPPECQARIHHPLQCLEHEGPVRESGWSLFLFSTCRFTCAVTRHLGLRCLAEREIEAASTSQRMKAFLERHNAVVTKPRWPTPDDHVAMLYWNPLCLIATA